MNDRPDPLDELASVLLDGEATAEEQARAGEPAVRSRVAAFEAVSRALAQPVPPAAPAERDAAIAAAVAAAVTEPVPLASRRAVAARRWLPAAAAVLVVAGALGLIATTTGDDDDSAPTAAELEASRGGESTGGAAGSDDSAADADNVEESTREAPASHAPTTTPSIALSSSDLGVFATEDELVAAVLSLVEGMAPSDSVPLPEGTTCLPDVDGVLQLARTATVDGEGLYVFVLAVEDGRRLIARAASDCALRYDLVI